MNIIVIITLLLTVSFLSSCKKDQDPTNTETDYLIFGHFYGMCQGETCVETFLVTDQKLFEDENDSYSVSEPFNFNELSSDDFELVKSLIESFPPELLNDTNSTFGCPDCADQGGLLIKLAQNGEVKSWRIDQSKMAVPQYLHAFMDSVNVSISLLSNQ